MPKTKQHSPICLLYDPPAHDHGVDVDFGGWVGDSCKAAVLPITGVWWDPLGERNLLLDTSCQRSWVLFSVVGISIQGLIHA